MWKIGGREFSSRLILGTARYPSPAKMREAVAASGAEIVTVSLRRQTALGGQDFWRILRSMGVAILPNTAGCRSVLEVLTTARMAREIFQTQWIKLETVGDEYTLQPEPFVLLEAARVLLDEGFEVFPYITEDLVVAERLVAMGCRILMPWASPIGSGQGLIHPGALKVLRARFRHAQLLVDAGLGWPSHASEAMQLGYDGVLLNSAVALAQDPVKMAEAFALAVRAGRLGYKAGLMVRRDFAEPSTPNLGLPFWRSP